MRACSQHAETHHGIHLHSKGVCSCGTSKLLAERPTSRPSKCIVLSVTRVVSGASIHPAHTHEKTPHACFGPAKTPPWTPLYSKLAHNIRHLRERAHLLDERATSRLSKIKMHHVERRTGLEWRAHAHNRWNAPHACFGHAKNVPRALCSHMVLAMAPLIARATRV